MTINEGGRLAQLHVCNNFLYTMVEQEHSVDWLAMETGIERQRLTALLTGERQISLREIGILATALQLQGAAA